MHVNKTVKIYQQKKESIRQIDKSKLAHTLTKTLQNKQIHFQFSNKIKLKNETITVDKAQHPQ